MPDSRNGALKDAARKFEKAGVETPVRDARVLLTWSEQIDAAALIAQPDVPIRHPERFADAVSRREQREPVSKIVGERQFWKHSFYVTSDVLDPRPDTETLVAAALDAATAFDRPKILDMGTGSGCILLSLLADLPHAIGTGTDISEAALAVAKQNAMRLNLTERADFLLSDWFERLDGTFDLVVCNPPYISETERSTLSPEVSRWDPDVALFSGMDGLQAYRRILDGLRAVLSKSGIAFLEIGAGQAEYVGALGREAGFDRISSRVDLGGHERCLVFRQALHLEPG